MKYRPEAFELSQELKRTIEQANFGMISNESVLIRTDLDNDGEHEYMLVFLSGNSIKSAAFYYQDKGRWQFSRTNRTWGGAGSRQGAKSIRTGEISTVAPRFGDLLIGDQILRSVDAD